MSAKYFMFHVFEVPWNVHNSVIIPKKFENSLDHFPFSLKYNNENDQIAIDDYVHNYSKILYHPDSLPLPIAYPTAESMEINIPSERNSNLVYINESYDSGWKAYYNNKEQIIQSTGPNFILVILDNNSREGVLKLQHTWHPYFYIGLLCVFILPIAFGIISHYQKGIKRTKHEIS